MSDLAQAFVEAIRSVIGCEEAALHEPLLEGNELAYLTECVDTNYVSSVGPFVTRFEEMICSYTGSERAVAVSNGTAALHVALQLAGVRPGDEVLMPSFTFAATANAVTYCGAAPHFVDIEPRTLGVDSVALDAWLRSSTYSRGGELYNRSTGRRISAVVPMHAFGQPCEITEIVAVGDEFGICVVEDAAESLGSWYAERHTGTFGLLGILSFNGNKVVTTGGGGAILTNEDQLGDAAKHLTTTAKIAHPWEFVHDQVGYNYRMPNINAALGCAQMERLPEFVDSKRSLFVRYATAFSHVPGVTLLGEAPRRRSNYWLQTVLLDEEVQSERNTILSASQAAGLGCRPAWRPMHQLQHFRTCPSAPLPVTEALAQRVINIPSSARL